MRPMAQGPQAGYGASYYPPPPPLQQQYPHSQQQNTYPGRHETLPTGLYDSHTTLAPPGSHAGGSQYSAQSLGRYDAPQLPHPQQAGRSFSPLGGSPAFPPLSRLNTGSSHSTNPSISAGMSSSMSMLPPGYGREDYGTVVPSSVHSRAQSVTGSVGGLASQPAGSLAHSRAQSISQLSDSGRTLSGGKTSAGGATTTTGLFSPPLQGHSGAASVSGSANSPSPSAAAFNFFTGPSTQVHGSSSMQSSVTSNAGNASAFARIAPIGRPSHGKTNASEPFGNSRIGSKSNSVTGQNSAVTSGVTSPLSSGFSDGWLDSGSSLQHPSSAHNEGQNRNVHSVWN